MGDREQGCGGARRRGAGGAAAPGFGELVRRYLEGRGLSPEELAAALQVEPDEVVGWLEGETPDVADLFRFCLLAGLRPPQPPAPLRDALRRSGGRITAQDLQRATEVAEAIAGLSEPQRGILAWLLETAYKGFGPRP